MYVVLTRPGVVGAAQQRGVADGRVTGGGTELLDVDELHAAVPADVMHGVQRAVVRPGDDDAVVADREGEVVARAGGTAAEAGE